jgi:hypothetical protein
MILFWTIFVNSVSNKDSSNILMHTLPTSKLTFGPTCIKIPWIWEASYTIDIDKYLIYCSSLPTVSFFLVLDRIEGQGNTFVLEAPFPHLRLKAVYRLPFLLNCCARCIRINSCAFVILLFSNLFLILIPFYLTLRIAFLVCSPTWFLVELGESLAGALGFHWERSYIESKFQKGSLPFNGN